MTRLFPLPAWIVSPNLPPMTRSLPVPVVMLSAPPYWVVELLFNKIDVRRCVIGPHAALAFGSGVVDPPAVAQDEVVAVAGRDSLDSLVGFRCGVVDEVVGPAHEDVVAAARGDGVAAADAVGCRDDLADGDGQAASCGASVLAAVTLPLSPRARLLPLPRVIVSLPARRSRGRTRYRGDRIIAADPLVHAQHEV